MTDDVRWLTRRMADAFHDEAIVKFGGQAGVQDEGLLESALARAPNRHEYDKTASLTDLAAEYCFGIIRNHPYVDGNKRTGLVAAAVFLSLNGLRLAAGEAETVATIESVAAGGTGMDGVAHWLADNTVAER